MCQEFRTPSNTRNIQDHVRNLYFEFQLLPTHGLVPGVLSRLQEKLQVYPEANNAGGSTNGVATTTPIDHFEQTVQPYMHVRATELCFHQPDPYDC